MMIKKLFFSFAIILLLSLSIYALTYFADNRNLENPPEEVILLNFEFTNVYLVPLSQGYAMVDNAYEHEYPQFLNYINDYGIDIQDIKYILLTHHHDDHVGFLNQITNENPEVKVILHKKTATLLASGSNNKSNGGGIVNKRIYTLFRLKQLLTPEWNLSFPPYKVREHDIVIDADRYDLSELLGVTMIMIYTPGHTSDSVTFIYSNNNAFCGDLASNFLNWAGANYLTLFNEDIDKVYASWQVLIDNNVDKILTAHGKPFNIKNLANNMRANSPSDIVTFF
jgi:glyoxylase-like metal-dependent hydrolase (beta-lactamase superfamily II)